MVVARTTSALSKPAAQKQVEDAFIFKDFLSIASLLKWIFILLVIGIIELIAAIPPIKIPLTKITIELMSNYWRETVHFYTAVIIFLFINYIILYVGIKLYRAFTKYVIPFIKAATDLPFRLHQKLIDILD